MRRFAVALVCVLLPLSAHANLMKLGTGRAVTVGTTATALRDTSVDATLSRSVVACVPETESATVYMGGSGVTVANGVPVPPGKCYSPGERLDPNVVLYGIVATGATAVRVQESF